MGTSGKVVQACEKHWEEHKGNCSGFVRAVAQDLSVMLTGQANDILDQIQKPPWMTVSSGLQARERATGCFLVVAGLKANPHGHVVVVVPGALAHGKYPAGYWGRLGGTGKKGATINFAWNRQDRDKVIYRCRLVR